MNKSEYVIARVDPELKQRLSEYMQANNLTESQAIRALINSIPLLGKIPTKGEITLEGIIDHVMTFRKQLSPEEVEQVMNGRVR